MSDAEQGCQYDGTNLANKGLRKRWSMQLAIGLEKLNKRSGS